MVGCIIFGGVSSLSYGAVVDGSGGAYVAPERVYETIEIPGRSGNLVIDGKRYMNVEIEYPILFRQRQSLDAYRDQMMRRIGYQRLEDSRHPEEYRIARLAGGFAPSMHGIHNREGQVTLVFDCKPQRYLTVGERPLEFTASNPNALWNLGSMPAKPLIRVYGYGTLGVGGSTITIAEHGKAYVDIDSDIQDCYCGTENLNPYITLSRQTFPELKVGMTGLTMDGGITKVIVYPRWWRL